MLRTAPQTAQPLQQMPDPVSQIPAAAPQSLYDEEDDRSVSLNLPVPEVKPSYTQKQPLKIPSFLQKDQK